jgi:L-cysteine:1D-myo-inositol 2-amino-2-deoxy-alpha-D-glucopyranoside ligase
MVAWMRIFNTQSGAVEVFTPAHNPARMYVCGVTPYDTTHLGHAFTYIVFDVLLRLIEHSGTPVRYVQNVTDVDDPLFERARATGEDWRALAKRQVEQFVGDMAEMNARPVDVRPHVSGEIPAMLNMIKGLEAKDLTYSIGERLYFRTNRFPGYGQLGSPSPEYKLERAAETGNDPGLQGKESPLDFLLWQPSADDEPRWDSPWRPGRPGWHIECSAMSLHHLGEQIDIHGGGQDLIFPHHASEIAQSESFSGKRPFSRYWVHVGLVRLEGVKMSKSLGNLVFTRDLLSRFDADGIRLYLLSHYYRNGWDYDESSLLRHVDLAARLKKAAEGTNEPNEDADRQAATALAYISEDLNTPTAIKVLEDLANQGEKAGRAVRAVGKVLGLKLAER